MIHTHRYIARFVVAAETPLFVGSGTASLMKDALVQKDINGLPMIAGTSLTGVLRHALSTNDWIDKVFGSSNAIGSSSRLKVSPAYMLLNEHEVSEGILVELDKTVLARYSNLPSRQHVRITEKGVAADKGLFDNEVVYKGTRFIFELELRGTDADKLHWDAILQQVNGPVFRIGSGTRNGYGSLKVMSVYNRIFDLQNQSDFTDYVNFEPSLNSDLKLVKANPSSSTTINNYTHYRLNLKPDLFFVFSEGFGDDEADNKPLEEEVAVYNQRGIVFEKQTVIPASSIKGAISHRVAYHYNKMTQQYADYGLGSVGSNSHAVANLFGVEAGSKSKKEPQAGSVFISDWYYSKDEVANTKIFNHVATDRFTGGAMDGALFSEKVSNLLTDDFAFDIFVKNSALSDETVKSALEASLTDICKGLLPLGGMTTKGHGMFTGSISKNGEELYNYKKQTSLCQV